MKFFRSLVNLTRRMPIVTWIVGSVVVVWVVGGVLIGMPPVVLAALPIVVGAVTWVINRLVNRAITSGKRQGVVLASAAAALVVVFGLIQLVPYGKDHTNPEVLAEPQWSSKETRDLMVRACYGCHSNQVEYPSYAKIAPISWAIQSHIDEGREKVNYSEFGITRGRFGESAETIQEGSMPPFFYTMFGRHPEAKLTNEEKATLIAGLAATPGLGGHERGGEKGARADDDDD